MKRRQNKKKKIMILKEGMKSKIVLPKIIMRPNKQKESNPN